MKRLPESVFVVGFGVLTLGLGVGPLAGRATAEPLPADKLPETAAQAEKMPGAEGDYARRLHAHVHKRWADNFLRLVGEKLEGTNPLNDGARTAEVDITVAVDGQMV